MYRTIEIVDVNYDEEELTVDNGTKMSY